MRMGTRWEPCGLTDVVLMLAGALRAVSGGAPPASSLPENLLGGLGRRLFQRGKDGRRCWRESVSVGLSALAGSNLANRLRT